jgi:DNA-binding SARP family transcriptional activator/predicted ATPase/Tfp pilus assembly protein PilF
MAPLTIALLGPLQIHQPHGTAITLAYDKVRALLAYLAVEADRPHRRETLAELLWPDRDEPGARHSLSQALFSLRQSLGERAAEPPLLLVTRDTVQFNRAAPHELDITTFAALLDTVARHDCRRSPRGELARAGSRPCRTCARKLEQALALYRGPLLEHSAVSDSIAFDDWLRGAREQYQQQAIQVLERLTDYYEWRDELSQARAHLMRLLVLDPWREDAVRRLMRLCVADGERAAALEQYARYRQFLEDQLGIEPEQETSALAAALRAGHLSMPRTRTGSVARRNIPASPGACVGRERELAELHDLLENDSARLVTLLGPGGVGKTRLALEAAGRFGPAFAHGAWFVPLTPLDTADQLPRAIAAAIGLTLEGRAGAEEQLVQALHDRELLLILDNVEHLLESAGLLTRLLEQAPHLHLLVTSRERLNLRSEWVVTIDGLSLPVDAHPASLAASAAVQLFQATAARAAPREHLQPEDRAAIVEICHLLEGLPLAIELAASWTPVLSWAGIAQEIRTGLDFLVTSARDLPERHRSLRAVFEQSWQRLTPPEQRALRRLTVFQGGYGRAAAETITGTSLPILSRLVAQSLVRHSGEGRYYLHEVLRQFAAERLTAAPAEAYALHETHCTWYLAILAERETRLKSAEQTRAIAEIAAEYANVRAAWQWAGAHQRLDAVAAAIRPFWLFCEITGRIHEFLATMEALLARLDASPAQAAAPDTARALVRGRALTCAGSCFIRLGGLERGRDMLDRALEILAPLDTPADIGLARNFRAVFALAAHDYAGAEQELRASIACFESAHDAWGTGYSRNDLGMILLHQGRSDEARQVCQESLHLFRTLGDRRGMAFALQNLGTIALQQGDLAAAHEYHAEALAIRQEVDHRWGVAMSHIHLGVVAARRGAFTEARDYLTTGLRVSVAIHSRPATLHALLELAAVLGREGSSVATHDLLYAIAKHPDCDPDLAAQVATLLGIADPLTATGVAATSTALTIDQYVDIFLSGEPRLLGSRTL